MRIAVAGGKTEAVFLTEMLLKKKYFVVLINDDTRFCESIAARFEQSTVIMGDPRKFSVLKAAEISGFDIIISLCDEDADNLAICQMGKIMLRIEKNVCIVKNPKNVEIFKSLGVNHVISSAYTLANMLEQVSTIENLVQTLPIEEGNIVLTELTIAHASPAAQRCVKDIEGFPKNSIISCLIRNSGITVPNGSTVILPGDKLVVVSSHEASKAAEFALSGKK